MWTSLGAIILPIPKGNIVRFKPFSTGRGLGIQPVQTPPSIEEKTDAQRGALNGAQNDTAAPWQSPSPTAWPGNTTPRGFLVERLRLSKALSATVFPSDPPAPLGGGHTVAQSLELA